MAFGYKFNPADIGSDINRGFRLGYDELRKLAPKLFTDKAPTVEGIQKAVGPVSFQRAGDAAEMAGSGLADATAAGAHVAAQGAGVAGRGAKGFLGRSMSHLTPDAVRRNKGAIGAAAGGLGAVGIGNQVASNFFNPDEINMDPDVMDMRVSTEDLLSQLDESKPRMVSEADMGQMTGEAGGSPEYVIPDTYKPSDRTKRRAAIEDQLIEGLASHQAPNRSSGIDELQRNLAAQANAYVTDDPEAAFMAGIPGVGPAPEKQPWGFKKHMLDVLKRTGYGMQGFDPLTAEQLSERDLRKGYYDQLAEHSMQVEARERAIEEKKAVMDAKLDRLNWAKEAYSALTAGSKADRDAFAETANIFRQFSTIPEEQAYADAQAKVRNEAILEWRKANIDEINAKRLLKTESMNAYSNRLRALAEIKQSLATMSAADTSIIMTNWEIMDNAGHFEDKSWDDIQTESRDAVSAISSQANSFLQSQFQQGNLQQFRGFSFAPTEDGMGIQVQDPSNNLIPVIVGNGNIEQYIENLGSALTGLPAEQVTEEGKLMARMAAQYAQRVLAHRVALTANSSTKAKQELLAAIGSGERYGSPEFNALVRSGMIPIYEDVLKMYAPLVNQAFPAEYNSILRVMDQEALTLGLDTMPSEDYRKRSQ